MRLPPDTDDIAFLNTGVYYRVVGGRKDVGEVFSLVHIGSIEWLLTKSLLICHSQ
jgi:hypothetical protein